MTVITDFIKIMENPKDITFGNDAGNYWIEQMRDTDEYEALKASGAAGYYELVEVLENIKNITNCQPADYIKDHEFAINLIQTMIKVAESALKKARGE
jgi:hypothetical protein